MTPIERGARALCSLDGYPENTKFEGKPMWMSYINEATAVIRSMREPSEEMLQTAFTMTELGVDVQGVWAAMIDSALG